MVDEQPEDFTTEMGSEDEEQPDGGQAMVRVYFAQPPAPRPAPPEEVEEAPAEPATVAEAPAEEAPEPEEPALPSWWDAVPAVEEDATPVSRPVFEQPEPAPPTPAADPFDFFSAVEEEPQAEPAPWDSPWFEEEPDFDAVVEEEAPLPEPEAPAHTLAYESGVVEEAEETPAEPEAPGVDLFEFYPDEAEPEPVFEAVPAAPRVKRRRRRSTFTVWLGVLVALLLLGVGVIVAILATGVAPGGLIAYLPFVPPRVTPTPEGGVREPESAPAIVASVTVAPTERGDEAASTLAAANEPTSPPAGTPVPPLPTPTSAVVRSSTGIVQHGVDMILVPESTFPMGGGPAEPEHDVSLDTFYIDRLEVTNAQWEACVLEGACLPPPTVEAFDEPYYGNEAYADYPVVNVSWEAANIYCAWRGARLPTEAEWEMAARWNPQDESASIFPWGYAWEPSRLNACDESCPMSGSGAPPDDGWPLVAPADALPQGASSVGALHMAGNVWEWTADWYDEEYYEDSPAENPTGPASGQARVIRGGAWDLDAEDFFDARLRWPLDPSTEAPSVGLRCAVSEDDVGELGE